MFKKSHPAEQRSTSLPERAKCDTCGRYHGGECRLKSSQGGNAPQTVKAVEASPGGPNSESKPQQAKEAVSKTSGPRTDGRGRRAQLQGRSRATNVRGPVARQRNARRKEKVAAIAFDPFGIQGDKREFTAVQLVSGSGVLSSHYPALCDFGAGANIITKAFLSVVKDGGFVVELTDRVELLELYDGRPLQSQGTVTLRLRFERAQVDEEPPKEELVSFQIWEGRPGRMELLVGAVSLRESGFFVIHQSEIPRLTAQDPEAVSPESRIAYAAAVQAKTAEYRPQMEAALRDAFGSAYDSIVGPAMERYGEAVFKADIMPGDKIIRTKRYRARARHRGSATTTS